MSISALTQSIDVLIRQTNPSINDITTLKVLLSSEYIAYTLSLPTQPLEQPKFYFLSEHKVSVLTQLTQLNEVFVFDVDDAANLVYEIWRIRYSVLHEGPNQRYGRLLSSVNTSVTGMISDPYRTVLNKHPSVYLTNALVNAHG